MENPTKGAHKGERIDIRKVVLRQRPMSFGVK